MCDWHHGGQRSERDFYVKDAQQPIPAPAGDEDGKQPQGQTEKDRNAACIPNTEPYAVSIDLVKEPCDDGGGENYLRDKESHLFWLHLDVTC